MIIFWEKQCQQQAGMVALAFCRYAGGLAGPPLQAHACASIENRNCAVLAILITDML